MGPITAVRKAYTEEVQALRPGPVRLSREDDADLASFCAWAKGRAVDPVLWLQARFRSYSVAAERSGRRFRVLKPKQLASDAFLPQFREWGEARAAEERAQKNIAAEALPDVDREGVELAPHAEAIKRAMRQTPELCMSSALTSTLGWNPASPECRACGLARKCFEALPPRVRAKRSR